jgi:uncharacterized protein YndB with AHSA1/START domain
MDPHVHFQLELPAPIQAVWQAWTTEEGLHSFFAPHINMQLRPGGPFEILFSLDGPEGQRGAEGMIVMAFKEPEFFSFTWNAPPDLDQIRSHMSHVVIRFTSLDEKRTQLDFKEDGFAEGGQWDQRLEYFQRAWGAVVLPRLALRFDQGPVQWGSELDLEPYKKLVKQINH